MEALDCIWGYQEIEELKNMLLQTRIELETARVEAKEDMRRNEENVKQLLYFLKIACQERNEARHERDQLQRLLNKLMPVSPTEMYPVVPSLQVESPICTLLGNSSMTISDSISESYNPQSYGSSPVDSLLDMVSSPDLPNINMADSSNLVVPSHTFIPEYNCPNTVSILSPVLPEIDHASAVIDNLVKGKQLPQKGKLLQTVMEAGPLLKTLLVSGSLPQWRNPPPLHPFQVPPFSIKGSDPERTNLRPVANLTQPGHNTWNSSISEISYGSSQMYSTSTLTGYGTCLNKRTVSTSGVSRDFLQNQLISGKRQRCQ
ncbi:putative TOX high mobility group box protein [Thalictrum thalictroides]|uniref:Putative TOX high mobility group box protein n=1 Tax=Thalictrum thalictroides TaxID=46969 RepID=A0A7J6W6B0_THATH|nr:putative TOX high mobility group box protein [Thalictrum thalictroides]